MAYMSQEKKKELAPKIKAVLAKYGMKGTLGVRHHSTLVLNIKSGRLDILKEYNTYWAERAALRGDKFVPVDHCDVGYGRDMFTGENEQFVAEIREAMNVGNWDKSDIQTDYFNVGWYTDINIGKWDEPYIHTPNA